MRFLLILFILSLVLLPSAFGDFGWVKNLTISDSFADGDYTNNPTWTVGTGVWTVANTNLSVASGTSNGFVHQHNIGRLFNSSAYGLRIDTFLTCHADPGTTGWCRVPSFAGSTDALNPLNGYVVFVHPRGTNCLFELRKTDGSGTLTEIFPGGPILPCDNNCRTKIVNLSVQRDVNGMFTVYCDGNYYANYSDKTYGNDVLDGVQIAGIFGGADFVSVDDIEIYKWDVVSEGPSLNWQGYVPLNNSEMVVSPQIFYFNHSLAGPQNCSLWKNDTVTISVSGFPKNLTALYRFEEGSGSIMKDNSSYSNDGAIYGGVYKGSKGGNGTGSYDVYFGFAQKANVSSNTKNSFGDQFTISFWVNLSHVSGTRGMVSKGYNASVVYSNYYFYSDNNNASTFGFGNGVTTNSVISSNKAVPRFRYVHIAGRVNNSHLSIFVNGKLNKSASRTINPLVSGKPLLVGVLYGSTASLSGEIDEIALFSRALNSSDISKIYDSGISLSYSSKSKVFVNIRNQSNVSANLKNNFSVVLPNSFYRLYASCDGLNSSTKYVFVNGSKPEISFLKANNPLADYVLVNGLKVEFVNLLWNFTANISGAVSSVFKLKSSLGTEIQTVNSSVLYVPGLLLENFVSKNPFVLEISANNSFGGTISSLNFLVNDTFMPVCGPLVDGSVLNGTDFYWNVSCSDEYFFSFNTSCDNGFNYYKGNIGNTSWQFVNHSKVLYPGMNCLFEYCDGHTADAISDMVVESKSLDGGLVRSLSFDSVTLFAENVEDFSVEKGKDRYSFCADLAYESDSVVFSIPDGCVPAKGSRWKGHLVCPAERMWFDFENADAEVSIKDGKVIAAFPKPVMSACFSSVGKFNCVDETQFIEGILPPAPPKVQFDSVSEALWFFFITFLWLAFLLGAIVLRGSHGKPILVLALFQMVIGIFLGLNLISAFGLLIIGYTICLTAVAFLVGLTFTNWES